MPKRTKPQEEGGATSGKTHRDILEQTLGHERGLKDATKEPPAPQEE